MLPTMLKHTLHGHEDEASRIATSGDSKHILGGSKGRNGSMSLWRADTGQHVCTFQGHEHGVWSVDFKGRSTLVSGGADKTIKVWALSDGEAPALLHTLRGHTATVLAVKVSPDGMKIASNRQLLRQDSDGLECAIRRAAADTHGP